MTVTVEEDFREFVVARWGELEPLARLVTLDDATARAITTQALAELHGQWGRLLDEGSPGAAARGAVLARSLAAAHGPRTGLPARAVHGAGGPASDDAVLLALVDVVRAATPLERAVLGADVTWGLEPGRVADLAGVPPGQARDAGIAVRARLVTAHTRARAAGGWEPAEWAVDRDVADALDLLLTGHPEPPDAVALVDEQQRRVRRRSVVLGTAAAVAAAAAGAWVVDAVGSEAASGAATLAPRPGDPAWSMTSTWPARGRLAGDRGVAELVASASPRAHLLWADDLAGQRVVVAATVDGSGASGTLVRVWAGPSGAAAQELVALDLVRGRVLFIDDVVTLAVEGGPDDEDGAGAVLLLARPTVLEAQYSPVVAYGPSGDVGRRWAELPLHEGVGTVALRGPLPPAFRVRLDGYDAGPLGATTLGLPAPGPGVALADGLLAALGPFVAACTGLPEESATSTVVLDDSVPGDVLVRAASGERVGRGQVVVAHTRLPSGALLRTVRVAGDGRGQVGPLDLETTRAMSPDAASAPVVARLPAFASGTSRFLVLAPGAAKAQLVDTVSGPYPASEVTRLHQGSGVLEVADARRAAAYALITWSASGRRIGQWETLFRRHDPRDLWPRVR